MLLLVALTLLLPAVAALVVYVLTPIPRRRVIGMGTVLGLSLLGALPVAVGTLVRVAGPAWAVAAAWQALTLAVAVLYVRQIRRLARHVDGLRDPAARGRALAELRAWLLELEASPGTAGYVVPGHARDAGTALIDLGLYDEACEILELGVASSRRDEAPLRFLAAVAELGRGDVAAAARRLAGPAAPRSFRADLAAARALVAAIEGGEPPEAPAGAPRFATEEIGVAVAALARAHALAARSDERGAVEAIEGLDDPFTRRLALELARGAGGPASPALSRLEMPHAAYR